MWARPGPWDHVIDFFTALGSLPLERLAIQYGMREGEVPLLGVEDIDPAEWALALENGERLTGEGGEDG